jgi:benzoyl-CoA reductase subunit C
MPVWVPRELLWAQNVLPVGVVGAGEDLEIIRGDAYFQSYICHIPRATIELGLNGSLGCLDGMLFPATCDVIRNLSGMWKMLFPDKLVRYLDVPQEFSMELGGRFWRSELEELSGTAREARGEALLGRGPARRDSRLQREPRARRRALRAQGAPAVEAADLGALPRPARRPRAAGRRAHAHAARVSRPRAREHGAQPMDQARVLLTGSFCEQPPLGLIKTLERAGCYIVDDDDFVPVHRWIEGDIREDGDPLENLVRAFLENGVQSAIRYIADREKGRELVDRVRRARPRA